MIKPLLEKINKFISSDEFYTAMGMVAHKRELNEDQADILGAVTTSLLLGNINEKDFAWHIADRCELRLAAAEIIVSDLHAQVLNPFKKELATEFGYGALVQEKPVTPVAAAVTQPAESKPIENNPTVVGAHKLKPIYPHIENVPKRIIDTSHLIDDTIDERPKLQDHYTD